MFKSLGNTESGGRVVMKRQTGYFLMAIIGLLICTTSAKAQSSIAGIVKDTSGAVVAGATVTVTSPALIEHSRSTVTDGGGQYKIVDLRPGTYVVTFTLTGFATVNREGLDLPADFTAAVDAEMKPSTQAETVTVTGTSPIIDVEESVGQTIANSTEIDTVPTSRDPFTVGELTPGITMVAPDVAGTQTMQQPVLQEHGSNTRDMLYMQDGMIINNPYGNGNQTGFYYNAYDQQSIVYETSALPASVPVGGVAINMVPREGGNEFHGDAFASGAPHSFESDNGSPSLRAKGFTAPNSIQSDYDFNGDLGGPIVKNHLWFFGSVRRWASNEYVGQTFNPDGTQAIADSHIDDETVRFTYSPNAKMKFFVSEDRGAPIKEHRYGNEPATFQEPIATLYQTTPEGNLIELKWTWTISPQLLFTAAGTALTGHFDTGYQPGTPPGAEALYDIGKNLLSNAAIYDESSDPLIFEVPFVANYVTGHHNLQIGTQIRYGRDWFSYQKNGDILLEENNGVPYGVLEYNTPAVQKNNVNADDSVFAQDSWTRKRLTLNLGVRYDHLRITVPAQSAPPGSWVPARSISDIPVSDWNNVEPRIGGVYDLFGNGKTAIRASASEYVENEGVELAQLVNPIALTDRVCAWSAPVNATVALPSQISGCGAFVSGPTTKVDPNLKRPTQWEYTAGVQQQLAPRLMVGAAFYHRHIFNFFGIRNLDVPASDYTPVTINNPLTNQPLTVYNQNPATLGLSSIYLTNQSILSQGYNGADFTVRWNFPNGSYVGGGFTVGSTRGTTLGDSLDLNNPNYLINDVGAVGYDARYVENFEGSWQLPYHFQWSATLRAKSGLPIGAGATYSGPQYIVTRSIVPGLTQVSQTVLAAPSGQYRYPDTVLLDMRFAKSFSIRERMKVEPFADIFNTLNSNAITNESTTLGTSYGKVATIIEGRILRLGCEFHF